MALAVTEMKVRLNGVELCPEGKVPVAFAVEQYQIDAGRLLIHCQEGGRRFEVAIGNDSAVIRCIGKI